MKYDRQKAVDYAKKYALSPNPNYYFFGGIGGDCTNFVSQCLHAGGFDMIFLQIDGWFYKNPSNRSASWAGVEYFRRFLLSEKFPPHGKIVLASEVEIGDVVFLFDGQRYYHSLIITQILDGEIYTSSHSYPSLNRKLNSYPPPYEFVHIKSQYFNTP